MSERVKARRVGESVVVTIPKTLLEATGIAEGDSLALESLGKERILLRKEGKPMASLQRAELELDILVKRRAALAAELSLVESEHNNSMPTAHPGITDDYIMEGFVKEQNWEISKLEVAIAEKRLELLEMGGKPE